ncbi:MAG TPA: isocitrate lyase/phosphoenolpyruvate mutase family protein, partial [Ktedonobacterales bacterium]|nr:isocitrate lyase/phosphoenolpyruvate mutase family protein [Ktedonobacterales bacterium]
VWDAASAAVVAGAGVGAIATTSSGMAAAVGYPDGQRIGRDMLVAAVARITRVVACPVTVDIEAGYGDSVAEVAETVRAVIGAGAVGFNIEDSRPVQEGTLVDLSQQVELIRALRDLAGSLGVPYVINARVDVFLRGGSADPAARIAEAVRRGNAYLAAGADCVYPIGALDHATIAAVVGGTTGPVNILGGPGAPTIPELAQLGVARVSLGGRVLSALLGHLRGIAREILEQGTYDQMTAGGVAPVGLSSLYSS